MEQNKLENSVINISHLKCIYMYLLTLLYQHSHLLLNGKINTIGLIY